MDLRIAFVSTYPPRRCGIASFTKDLATSINNLNPERLSEIIAMDDDLSVNLDYPWEVSRRIRQDKWEDYQKALDYLNNSIIDVVSIQHEYGIFGGDHGKMIVNFTRKLKKPYIVTFHTVLKEPKPIQKWILQQLAKKAVAVVVMLPVAIDILRDEYGISPQKVIDIHHGTPDVPFSDDGVAKRELGYEGKILMSSVNLISKWKGLEYAIEALPEVVKKYPNFLYLIVGQTHPVIINREGEAYRERLKKLSKDLGVEKNVEFINKYVPLEDLIRYVKASDFYVTPYEGLEQISSGSLAYAIAAGKLCISTSYLYAKEMLSGGCGYLVPPKNPEKITEVILHALAHPEDAYRMRLKCYAQGRKMTWERVGFRYIRLIDHLLEIGHRSGVYPKATLSYLNFLTHEHGLLEHSIGDQKNYETGYSVDDNARGLIVALQYGDRKLASKYLNFISAAEESGKLYCDMDKSGNWIKDSKLPSPGLGEWFGRSFWAVCYAMGYAPTINLRRRAEELIVKLLSSCQNLVFLRTAMFVLLGLSCLNSLEWNELVKEREAIFKQIIALVETEFDKYNESGWHWPEESLTYDNARIPYALLEASLSFQNKQLQDLGLQMLDFLLDTTFDIKQGHFRFIGNKGWYTKGGTRAFFDEQPIEAGSTVQACFSAFKITKVNYYKEMAKKAFAWYHGDNILRRPLYNQARGSVFDGILPETLSFNQGAEATLEYLLANACYCKLIDEPIKQEESDLVTFPVKPFIFGSRAAV